MPIVPEKLASRQDVKSAIACQFWEQPSHSTRSIDGLVWSLPCEPPTLNLTGSSGLSRTQQLIAAQALGVPAFPSYDANSNGLVLDRVLAKLGGNRWWLAVGGRVKAQRIWSRGAGVKGKVQSVKELDNYGLVARGRFQLARRLTLNGVVETRNVTLLHRHVRRHTKAAVAALRERLQRMSAQLGADSEQAAADEPALQPGLPMLHTPRSQQAGASSVTSPRLSLSPGPASPRSSMSPMSPLSPLSPLSPGGSRRARRAVADTELCRAHASLKYSLPGHDLTATVGYQQDYVDSNGEYAHVPLAASLDLASQYRPDGLQYRVGLHQVTAPAIEGSSKAAQRMRTTLHVQGAVAVEGEAHIWKPAAPSSTAQAGQQQQQQVAAGAGGAGAGSSAAAAAGAAVPASAQGTPSAAATEPAAPASQAAGAPASSGGAAADASSLSQGAVSSAAPSIHAASSGGQVPVGGQPSEPASGEAPASRVATALASAARADAGPDPASLPQRKPRRLFRRRKRAGAEQGEDVSGQQEEEEEEEGTGELLQQQHGNSHHAWGPEGSSNSRRAPRINGTREGTAPPQPGGNGSSSLRRGNGGSREPGLEEQPGAAEGQQSGARAGAALESFIKPLGDLIHTVTHPQGEGGAASGAGHAPAQPRGGASQEQADNLLSVSAHTIQAGIQESLALLQQVKESVARLTSEVQEGSLQRMSQQLSDSSGRKEVAAPRRRPYSVFLSQPHLKLNGSMGCLARMPLPSLRGFGPPLGRLGLHPTPGAGSSGSLSSLGSIVQAWEPYLKGTSLRLFASGGISGQLGRFTRPFLDYTAVGLRADVGLTSPHVVGLLPDPAALDASDTHRPDKHRAFALEGRGSWHSLSASLAQQVVGPVRARADFRFALDPTNMPQNAGERSTIKGLVQTALSVRPSLLEAVFGFDVVLPGTEGVARLACWWSPHRREAMAELRLF